MRIAITGSNGFLGSNILKLVADCQDIEVLAISSKPRLIASNPNVETISNEELLSNPSKLYSFDTFINCAFPRNEAARSMAEGLEYLNRILIEVGKSNIAKVINVSSQSVYSQKRIGAADENELLSLESKYAVAKYSIELLTDALCQDSNVIHIRLASLIGPSFDQRLPNKLVAQALSGKELRIKEAGNKFGYLHVKDAARGILSAAIAPRPPRHHVYNLGPVGSCTITDQVNWIKESLTAFGIEVPVFFEEIEMIDEPINTTLDSSRFENEFHWMPEYSIREAISSIATDYAMHHLIL